MLRRASILRRLLPSSTMAFGYLLNWKIFEPRKLNPLSIEPRSAETVVITPMTENTPIVMPAIVSIERSLFTPSEANAIRRISLNNMFFIFVTQCDDRIEARGAPGGREARHDAGHDRHHHADDDQA